MHSTSDATTAAAVEDSLKFLTPDRTAAAFDRKFIRHPMARLIGRRIAQKFAEGGGFIIFEAPPRHGKSWMVSKWTPIWFLHWFPGEWVTVISYGATFASRWGRMVRSVIKEHGPALGLKMDKSKQSSTEIELTTGGGMFCTGIGGELTGRGFRLMVIDDPVKNAEEAHSEVIREKQWEWWQSVAATRLEPGAVCVVMMCVAEGERVCMADGTWRPIEAIKAGESVLAYEGGEFEPREVTASRCSGEDEILEVSSSRGRLALRVNARHPFLLEDGTWRKASELSRGDRVVTLNERIGGQEHDPGFAWFFGFMVGDGWVTLWEKRQTYKPTGKTYKSRAWCVCVAKGVHGELNARVIDSMERYLGKTPKETRFGYYRVDSASAGRRLEGLGLTAGVGALLKRVPDWIFRSDRASQRAFLKGLCEADGWRDPKYDDTWRLVSGSLGLIEDARLVAMLCGVRPGKVCQSTRTNTPPNSPAPITSTAYSTLLKFDIDAPRIDVISEVKPAGRSRVYDITVAGSECFVAEGFVVHNTRWHEDDLIGRLKAEMAEDPEAEQWDIVRIPAICEEVPDPLGRSIGDALWPERWPMKALKKIAKRVGGMAGYFWAAMYQQRPAPLEGGFFERKWLHIVESCFRKECFRVRSWDLAGTTDGDATAGVLIARDWRDDTVCIEDIVRVQMRPHDVEQTVIATAKQDGPGVTILIQRDPGQAGIAQFERYERLLGAEGFRCEEYRPTGDKDLRIVSTASPIAQAGDMSLVRANWNAPFLDESGAFPNGKRDDMLDALASGLDFIAKERRRILGSPKTNAAREHDDILGRIVPGGGHRGKRGRDGLRGW